MDERLPKFYSLLTRSHPKNLPNTLVFSSLVYPGFRPALPSPKGLFVAATARNRRLYVQISCQLERPYTALGGTKELRWKFFGRYAESVGGQRYLGPRKPA